MRVNCFSFVFWLIWATNKPGSQNNQISEITFRYGVILGRNSLRISIGGFQAKPSKQLERNQQTNLGHIQTVTFKLTLKLVYTYGPRLQRKGRSQETGSCLQRKNDITCGMRWKANSQFGQCKQTVSGYLVTS